MWEISYCQKCWSYSEWSPVSSSHPHISWWERECRGKGGIGVKWMCDGARERWASIDDPLVLIKQVRCRNDCSRNLDVGVKRHQSCMKVIHAIKLAHLEKDKAMNGLAMIQQDPFHQWEVGYLLMFPITCFFGGIYSDALLCLSFV